jgi:heme-degrading monooxygenase HmoA
MFARVSSYQFPADQAEQAVQTFTTAINPLRQLDGAKGAYLLLDRSSGKALTITLWQSEEAADKLRSDAAGPAGGHRSVRGAVRGRALPTVLTVLRSASFGIRAQGSSPMTTADRRLADSLLDPVPAGRTHVPPGDHRAGLHTGEVCAEDNGGIAMHIAAGCSPPPVQRRSLPHEPCTTSWRDPLSP